MNEIFQVLTTGQLEAAAQFIATYNCKKQHHIGYCGTQKNDILKALHEDFVVESNTTLCAAYHNQSIHALIGFDIDGEAAEVWGPFSTTDNLHVQHQLWQFVKEQFPTISKFHFFINEQNVKQLQFMNELQASKTGEHLYLQIHRHMFDPVTTILSQCYVAQDFTEFSLLHHRAFPNTYYDSKQIVENVTRRKENKLKILKSNGILQGYAYYELDLDENTAHLEYIAIAPEYRGLGLGTTLLKEVLTDIFSYDKVQQITLTVNNTNDHANYVYFKAGFKKKDVLWSFSLK